MTNDEQVEQFEDMVRKHKSRIVNSENIDIPDDLLNYFAEESTKKEAPRSYTKKRKHLSKAQLAGYGLAVTIFLSSVGIAVGKSLAKDEFRNAVDPILTEAAENVAHDYESAFRKNDLNLFYGFTPDGNVNIERDSSRNYLFMNEYFIEEGTPTMKFFEYLVGRFGINEVLKGGIEVSVTIKGIANRNDMTSKEFLGGKSVKEWAKDMYNEFAEEDVLNYDGKGL